MTLEDAQRVLGKDIPVYAVECAGVKMGHLRYIGLDVDGSVELSLAPPDDLENWENYNAEQCHFTEFDAYRSLAASYRKKAEELEAKARVGTTER